MKLVHESIRFPVTTAVGVLLLMLFGLLALARIPVQLVPTVEEPQVTVTTIWPGASPQEVEREIVDEQEEQLKSLENLRRMESTSNDSSGSITLTFQTGTDLDTALLRVSNRLQQVPTYPPDAERPVLTTVGPGDNAVAWYEFGPLEEPKDGYEPYQGDISTLYDLVDNLIKPELERVAGVAGTEIYGGREREMHVLIDPEKLAGRQVTVTGLLAALDRENRNVSGGGFDEGKRRYTVRTVGEYASPEEIEDVVVAVRGGVPVYVRDIARTELGYERWDGRVFGEGEARLAISVQRETGANVLDTMAAIRQTADRLNRELLTPRGLRMSLNYDETDYITSAIDLVRQSLLLGALFAGLVLLFFLRSASSTLIVMVAIPISIVGTFLMMLAFGRTVNVISLAGMAFAVGMVVDNSIVVLENIYRHRQMGKSRFDAAYGGASEVWGAVLASTATTVAVFLPVVFIQEEAGQLFRDIAIAISCGVALSLLVSITVIPSLSAKILGAASRDDQERGFHGLWGGVGLARRVNDFFARMIDWICRSVFRRVVVVLGFTGAAAGLSMALLPPMEYLPLGNQNFVFGLISPPPGYNVDELTRLQDPFVESLSEYWQGSDAETAELPGGGIRNIFFVLSQQFTFIGAQARDPMRVKELIGPFSEVSSQIPGMIAFFTQASIFQRGLGRGRNVEIDLTGPQLDPLLALAGQVFVESRQLLPGAQVRPIPFLDLGSPEVQVVPKRRRAADLGLSSRDIGVAVSSIVDGIKASEYRYEGRKIDLEVIGENGDLRPETLAQLPLATPDGRLVTLGSLADVEITNGPTQIRRLERERAITIAVTPREDMALQDAMEAIEREILDPLREEGRLGVLYRARLAGSADKLTEAADVLQWNFILAIVITYLLMSALFENFLYPLVILFSVPLAALGGVLGLAVLNLFMFQALDVLTMLGFIILVGTVVNNAILIVHQTLNHQREEGMAPRDAIREATRIRVRPIFMSVMTSACGMLPLVLFPGAGSELYRGLGSVVVGGLLVSTVFTLVLVPSLLSLVLDAYEATKVRLAGLTAES